MTAAQANPSDSGNHSSPAQRPRLIVLSTGGTISCTHDATGALSPSVSGEELVTSIRPRFTETLDIEVHDLCRFDSSSMTLADIDTIVEAAHEALADPEVIGVVITHGTDSLEETAIALDTFHNDSRPIVLTGAQRPFDHPKGDGYQNLFEAIVVASDPSARDIGVLVVFGHAVLPARGCLKWHTSDELAFATNGPEEPERAAPVPVHKLADVRVEIIAAFPGAPERIISDALARGAEGLVIEAMGSGNVGTHFAQGIAAALHQGIPVVITTRVPRGNVAQIYGGSGGGASLARDGALSSTYFRAGQARILLAIALASGIHPATLF